MRAPLLVVLALTAPAAAQPRGEAVIDHYSLQALRAIGSELAAPLGDPLSASEYARIVELRRAHPELSRLGALDDQDLAAVAAALCNASDPCVEATLHALRCLADRCVVAIPPDARRHDLVTTPAACEPAHARDFKPAYGLALDWGTGWQRSKYPSDGGAWSFGIEGRARFGRFLGAVARVDRIAGRDAAEDANHDNVDDVSTGSIIRIAMLAGPSLVLDNARYEDTTGFVRLDLLGGYVATGSQPNESGPAAGLDLGYQVSVARFGVRVVQAFGDARAATMVLAHFTVGAGSIPPLADDCTTPVAQRSSRLALGLDLPVLGYGLSSQLGYLVPGLGVEAVWHLTHALDAVTHGDLLVYPGWGQDRVLHQAMLAGVRFDHERRRSGSRFFTMLLAGYSHGIGVTPTTVGSGPVVDASFAWAREEKDGAGWVRVHARFGIGPDNLDYRAIFFSTGFELRVDPDRWSDRD